MDGTNGIVGARCPKCKAGFGCLRVVLLPGKPGERVSAVVVRLADAERAFARRVDNFKAASLLWLWPTYQAAGFATPSAPLIGSPPNYLFGNVLERLVQIA
jgi:hypothetical protein